MTTEFAKDFASEVEQTQSAVTEYSAVEAGLSELTAKYGNIVFDMTQPKALEDAKAARVAIREPRYRLENLRKAAKAPLLKMGRLIDDEAERIKVQLLAIETPIDNQIKAEEQRREEEKERKRLAEQARVNGIRAKIDEIRRLPFCLQGKHSTSIRAAHIDLAERSIGLDEFAEFTGEAEQSRQEAVATLDSMAASAELHEAAQAKLKAEREAFEAERNRQKAEAAELERQRRHLAAQQAALQPAPTPATAAAVEETKPAPVAVPVVAEIKPAKFSPSDDEIISALVQHFKVPANLVIDRLCTMAATWATRAA